MLHCINLYIIYTHSCYREYRVGGKYESVYGERNADMDNLTNANQDSAAATEMKPESKSVRQKLEHTEWRQWLKYLKVLMVRMASYNHRYARYKKAFFISMVINR